MRTNLEFEYRAGNLTSYDITLLRGVRGVYGSDTPVRVRGCSFNRETRMEITHPTKPTKKMEVLVPWLLLEDEGGANLWVQLGDSDLDLDLDDAAAKNPTLLGRIVRDDGDAKDVDIR